MDTPTNNPTLETEPLEHTLYSRHALTTMVNVCIHEVDRCPFCGHRVAMGHDDDRNLVFKHVGPACVYFVFCENSEQFEMLAKLKIKSDVGVLERN